MSVPRTTAEFVASMQLQLQEQAVEAMLRPKKEPFDHGQQVGRYQGMQLFLDQLEDFLKPKNDG